MKKKFLKILFVSVFCFGLKCTIFCQKESVITPDEFVRYYDSVYHSDYIKLLNFIYANETDSVEKMISEKNYERIANTHSFEIDDINELKQKLDSYDWAAKSKRVIYNSDTKYYHSNFITIQIAKSMAKIWITDIEDSKAFKVFDGIEENTSPLLFSYKHGRKDIFNLLLDNNIDITSEHTIKKKNIIFHCIDNDSVLLFKKVYAKIENPDSILFDGMNMLHYAIFKNKPDHFDFLYNQGFKLTTPTAYGWFPVHFAAGNSTELTARILELKPSDIDLPDTAGRTALHHASLCGNTETIDVLLADKKDIDRKDNKGITPLMYASRDNSLIMVKALLSHGADYNLMDNDEKSCIQYALDGNECNTVKYFLRSKKYNSKTLSLFDLRQYSENICKPVLVMTRSFHVELKLQLNCTNIEYEGADPLVSGGYGVELSQRIIPYVDLCYTFNRLYVETDIGETSEVADLQLSDEHYSSYETNYFEHILSAKIYPVHYLKRNAPYMRIGYNFRTIKASGLLGGTSQMVDDLTDIASNNFQGINAGIGYLLRGSFRFSIELNYTHGLTDVNKVFPGSYNTFEFITGFGF